MATRRKYRQRADAPVVDNISVMPADLPPAPEPSDDNALVRAAAAARHAESLQQQHAHRQQIGLPEPPIDPAERQAIDAHIEGMGLSEHKARFLKSHPSLLTEPFHHLMRHAYMVAKHAGVPDDTPQMDHAILAGVARDIEHHRALSALTSASARPTTENAQAHQDVNEAAQALQREAEGHLTEFAAANPPPPPPAPRRSIPMSAPVSRDVPSASGGRFSDSTKVTLSPEQRDIAHKSRRDLPKHEAELLYARNLLRYERAKANGETQ